MSSKSNSQTKSKTKSKSLSKTKSKSLSIRKSLKQSENSKSRKSSKGSKDSKNSKNSKTLKKSKNSKNSKNSKDTTKSVSLDCSICLEPIDKLKNDFILTPGRYVGYLEEEDDGMSFEKKIKDLTDSLNILDEENSKITEIIKKNLKKITDE